MNYFVYNNYKTALKEAVNSKKKVGGRQFTFGKMAAACSVRKAFLSRVLSEDKSHLNEDQLFSACRFLGMTQVETNFMIMLRSYQRSSLQLHRENLEKQIETLRNKYPRAESTVKFKNLSEDQSLAEYFLDAEAILVRTFLLIEEYSRNVKLIAKEISISEQRLQEILSKLERLAIVELRDGKYRVLKDDLHLPTDSAFFPQFKLLQKISSFHRCQQLDAQKSYNFTVAFAANDTTKKLIQENFLKFLRETHALVQECSKEKVYQMNFDLFDWCQ